MDKRGVLGLDVAKIFLVLLIMIAVIGFVGLIIFGTLNDTADDILPQQTNSTINETVLTVTEAGEKLLLWGRANVACTITECISSNTTDETVIPTTNYSIAGCTVLYSGDAANDWQNYNNSDWNCTYSATYTEPYGVDLLGNTSRGIGVFFEDVPTWLQLLSIVIIIAIVSAVIIYVTRFRVGAGGIGGAVGGGRSGGDSLEI